MGKDQNQREDVDSNEAMSKLKPGQKYPTPTRGFGDRVFYETLLRQNPESEMAIEWCLAYGVLGEAEASKLHKIMVKRKGGNISRGSPSKTAKKSSTSTSGKTKKKKLMKEEVDDVMMSAGGSEYIGTQNI